MAPGGEGRRGHRRADLLLAASERLYGALLALYPEAFRRRYTAEMRRDFGELSREGLEDGGGKELAGVWATAFSDLALTALEERGTMLARNGYLPVAPGTAARWGALSALLGGILGVAFFLSGQVLYATGNFGPSSLGPFAEFFIDKLLLCALPLSSLALFGLHGVLVASSREARPGLASFVGAGAVFSTASALLWLAMSGYAVANELASGSTLFAPFEWLWYTGAFVGPLAVLFWFLGLLLLGTAAARQRRLPGHLRALPLGLFALAVPSCMAWLGVPGVPRIIANSETAMLVLGFAPTLLFVGVASLGWALLGVAHGGDAGPLAAPGGPEEGAAEKELLGALARRGGLTVAGAALETSLTVEEADRMLSALAAKGHLEVRVARGRLLYSLWEGDGPL